MRYYEVAILNSPLAPLVYHSEEKIPRYAYVTLSVRNKQKFGVVLKEVARPSFATLALERVSEYAFDEDQIRFASFLSRYYVCGFAEALGIMHPFSISSATQEPRWDYPNRITLSNKQNEALRFLSSHRVALLFGDTGSGKTEVYMAYFHRILAQKRRILFLMPEISLTPQMRTRLMRHFGESVVIWHSKLTKKQKEAAMEKIRSGEATIIAGPRSALFLPIACLGLIVVDEEHDDSYKSAQRPRLHARDAALYLAKLKNIPIVLGSATPSLGSYINYPHFRLRGRFFVTKRQFLYEAATQSLTPFILGHIDEVLQKGEQAVVFVPTRANFKYLQCDTCGEDFTCPFCSVGMSVHRKYNALRCHYCGFTQAIPKACPRCQNETLKSIRLGTAEVYKELAEAFPNARIEQFDRDSVTTQKKLEALLERFNKREIDILVGTQMLAKGHDYHGVTLAVVLGMDKMLGMGDYRAREKALAMLVQIAGRSGRKHDAKVVVQTFQREFFASFIEDFEAFLEEEKFFRQDLYPPFRRLARIIFTHKNAAKAQAAMEQTAQNLKRFEEKVALIAKGECQIAKVAGKYRYEILLRSKKATDLLEAIYASKTELAEVDMDPVEFT